MKIGLRTTITLILAMCLTISGVAASYALGDVNTDGVINMRDALMVYQIASGKLVADEGMTALADVTNDGSVNMRDALKLYQDVSRVDNSGGTDPIPGDNVGDDW